MESERRLIPRTSIEDSQQYVKLDPCRLNKITCPFPDERAILVPLYIRACLRELVSISAENESAQASLDFLVTYPFIIDPAIAKQLQMTVHEAGDLQRFLENNILLEIGGSFVDISQEIVGRAEEVAEPSQELMATIIRSAMKEQRFDRDQQQEEEDEREAEESRQSFYYKRLHDEGSYNARRTEQNKYATYLVSGKFECEGDLQSPFFPYHEIALRLTLRTHRLIYKETGIKFTLMRLDVDNWQGRQFAFGPQLPKLGRFGIYEVCMESRSVEGDEQDQQQEGEAEGSGEGRAVAEEGTRLSRQMSFCFRVRSFNVPFILRNQVPLWVLCLASFALNFALISQIANVFGNIILISVAQIGLLSNFRQGAYKTQFGGLYEVTLGGFILISLFQIIEETMEFYEQDGEEMLYQDAVYFHTTYIIALVLLVFNVAILMAIGCTLQSKRKFSRTRQQTKKQQRGLQWKQEDFLNCIPIGKREQGHCCHLLTL